MRQDYYRLMESYKNQIEEKKNIVESMTT